MTDLAPEALAALDREATQGEWRIALEGFHITDKRVWFDEEGARHGETPNLCMCAETRENAAFIVALVNLFRAGKLVHVDAKGGGDE